jgi:hypothetical protein
VQHLIATCGYIAVFVLMVAEPACLPVSLLTLKNAELGAGKGDLAGLSARLTAMQAWLELPAVSR